MPLGARFQSSQAFHELGDGFADAVKPAQFPKHILRFRNQFWAERIGLGSLTESEWFEHFADFKPLSGSLSEPLALRYHGHQFRSYNPQLGDGRGFLFAQMYDPVDQRLLDLATKGSGPTPYSRGGDGRLTLKGAVREVLATEMLESLGVNTSKTFSVIETGESLVRHDEPSPTRSAVLVRLSHSHIRFGTFQRHAYFNDKERLEKLLNYSVRHYDPDLDAVPMDQKPVAFFRRVVRRMAELCASWMVAGFVHGVLNTDNMNITGESFDYGPYRFLPVYDPQFTAAYFDHEGLYAYGMQPESVLWNLEQLASSFLHLSEREPLVEALKEFAPQFNQFAVNQFIERLGVDSRGTEQDEALFSRSFGFLAASQIGFEQFFHDWYGGSLSSKRAKSSPEAEKYQGEHFEVFQYVLNDYSPANSARHHLTQNAEYFQRPHPCRLLIDEIEWIWEAIDKSDDWSRFEKKVEEIRLMGQVYGRRQV